MNFKGNRNDSASCKPMSGLRTGIPEGKKNTRQFCFEARRQGGVLMSHVMRRRNRTTRTSLAIQKPSNT